MGLYGAVGFSVSVSRGSVEELENVILLKEKIHKTKRLQICYKKKKRKETLMILQAKFLMSCVSSAVILWKRSDLLFIKQPLELG